MKFSKQISAGLVSVGLLVAASAESQPAPAQNPVKFELPKVGGDASQPAAAPAAVAAPAPAAPKFTEAQIMEVYGYMMGARMGLAQLEFTPTQVEAMSKGLAEAAAGKQPGYELQQIGPQLQEFLAKKEQAFVGKLRAQGMADTAAFLTKLKENKAVQETPTGLRYEVLTAGNGATPKQGQLAKINYKLSFTDGRVVEDSAQRGEPVELLVQTPTQADPRGVIAGMAEGLQQMKVGGKSRFYVPPHLAYGDEGNQGIPPAATLVFEVELIDVKDAPKEAPAPAPAPGK
ncbi:MAG TPA: FKBP-type peptidyl-prolyl cis-trans isomerase [Candidatus Didemnitutus sp.]|nr:FKBP-type peptidyl-prolyl cis-trans isomerase [Candidatus Didemnitutus sp.]